MPRISRIDAAGALHHVMVRGIERGGIFQSDADRNHFLERLGEILKDTQTLCCAWALIPNHFHFLLRTGPAPISTVMRRLLTGYALWYNRKHRRHRHVFQNRFKSILCQEKSYFPELVRYIHLNPIRARLVKNLDELGRYAYSEHSVVIGKVKRPWQDTEGVLGKISALQGRRTESLWKRGLPGAGALISRAEAFYEAQGVGKHEVVERREGLSKERRENSG